MPKEKRKYPQRGEIWIVELKNTIGSEQSGMRPCIILNMKKKKENTCIIVPASHTKRSHSLEMKNFTFLLHQIRVIDTIRLIRKIDRFSKKETDSVGIGVQKIIIPNIKNP